MKIKNKNRVRNLRFNFVLFVLMLALLLVGCVFVYSASFYSANLIYGDKFFFLKKQILGIAVGLLGFFFFTFFDYKKLEKLKWPFLVISIILLILVFVPGIGMTNYGATRWINLRVTTLQPSEIAKFAFIVFSSSLLSKSAEKVKSFKGIIPVLIVGAIFCFLIIIEPNMSITICMALLVVVMMFLGGARLKHFLVLAVPAILLGVVLIVSAPYRLKRLVAFVDPFASSKNEGFQLVQSLLSVSLGGMFGSGIFKSRQKYLFLPFAESDFIFSIIAEEVGFAGSVVVIALFVLLFFAIMKVAKNANTKFGFLITSGVGAIIIIQVLLNISVVTGLVPPTGLPLPFISAGSTSLLVFMSAIGVVLNVDRQSSKNKL